MVWNSPGVVGAIPQWAVPLVAELVEGSAYVAVRDEYSLGSLRAAVGHTPEIHVVPDTAFGLGRRGAGVQTKQSQQHDVLVHASATVARVLRTDVPLLHKLRRLRVGVVEVGTALGDDVRRISSLLPSATNYRYRGVSDLLAAIENSRSVMSSSLHLTIGARAAGKEVLHFAHPKVRKHGIVSKLRDEQNGATRDFSFGRDALLPNCAADEKRETVAGHWNSIGSIFGTKRQPEHGTEGFDSWDTTCKEISRARVENEPSNGMSFASRLPSSRLDRKRQCGQARAN